nr:hypothetical protein [Tanacetum cinerariifolium]
ILDVVVRERVCVLLSCDEANGCGNCVRATAELSDDLIGALELWGVSKLLFNVDCGRTWKSYLCAGIGSSQNIADGGAGNSRGSSR